MVYLYWDTRHISNGLGINGNVQYHFFPSVSSDRDFISIFSQISLFSLSPNNLNELIEWVRWNDAKDRAIQVMNEFYTRKKRPSTDRNWRKSWRESNRHELERLTQIVHPVGSFFLSKRKRTQRHIHRNTMLKERRLK